MSSAGSIMLVCSREQGAENVLVCVFAHGVLDHCQRGKSLHSLLFSDVVTVVKVFVVVWLQERWTKCWPHCSVDRFSSGRSLLPWRRPLGWT